MSREFSVKGNTERQYYSSGHQGLRYRIEASVTIDNTHSLDREIGLMREAVGHCMDGFIAAGDQFDRSKPIETITIELSDDDDDDDDDD